MTKNPYVDQIDFDAPDEWLVERAIFWNVSSTQLRGFSDVFSEEQILRMGASDHVVTQWSSRNRSWLRGACNALCE